MPIFDPRPRRAAARRLCAAAVLLALAPLRPAAAQAYLYTGTLDCGAGAAGGILVRENGYRLSYQFKSPPMHGIAPAMAESGRGEMRGLSYDMRGSGRANSYVMEATISGARKGPDLTLSDTQLFTGPGLTQKVSRVCEGSVRRN